MRGRNLSARGKVFSLPGVVLLFAGMCLGLSAPVACGAIFSSGYVNPADPSSWTDATTAYIGNTASGALTVNGGSLLRSAVTTVGGGTSGTMTVDGSGTQWISTGNINVSANGRLDISGGAAVVNSIGIKGLAGIVDNGGVVNITGAGSRWSTDGLVIGYYGKGSIRVTKGGVVSSTSRSGINAGFNDFYVNPATSEVMIDGPGSIWNTNGFGMWVGTGSLRVTGGGLLTTGSLGDQVSGIGYGALTNYGLGGSYIGSAKVDGVGSRWLNNSDLRVENGVLSISGGGAVTAANVTVRPLSVLAIDAGRDSSLVVGGGSGEITNSHHGFVRILAGADAVSGATTSPISAATWSGMGVYQAVGGTWNSDTHEFTVSNVQSGEAGTQVSIDPAVTQRVLVTDGATGNAVGLSYLAASTAGTVTSVTATEMGSGPLTALAGLIAPNQCTLAAWDFVFAGTSPTNVEPVYLSFDVGSGYASNDLEIWRYSGTSWAKYDFFTVSGTMPDGFSDITCNGTWARFSITSAGGYAVVATVPEPGSVLLLMSALMMGLAALRRRGRLQGSR